MYAEMNFSLYFDLLKRNPKGIILLLLLWHWNWLELYFLQERELEILAGFLDHDVKIHREYYMLPESTTQVAKEGKLLMLFEKGGLTEIAGKALDNIEMDLNDNKK